MPSANLKAIFTAETKQFTQNVKKAREATNSLRNNVKNSSETIKNSFSSLSGAIVGPISGEIGQLTNLFSSTSSAIKPTIAGLNGFKIALAGTGIGILLVSLGSLVAYFSSTKEGADQINIILGYLKGTIGYLMDTLASFGKKIIEVFTHPKEAIQDLWNWIKNIANAITNLFSGISQMVGYALTGQFDKAKEAALNMKKDLKTIFDASPIGLAVNATKSLTQGIKDMNDTALRGVEMAKLENQLKKEKNDFIVREKKLTNEISELLLITNDKSKDNLERQKAINEAEAKRKQLTKEQLVISSKELEIKKLKDSLSNNSYEDDAKTQELEAKILDIQTQQNTELKKIVSLRNTINKEVEKQLENEKKLNASKSEDKSFVEGGKLTARGAKVSDNQQIPTSLIPLETLNKSKSDYQKYSEDILNISKKLNEDMNSTFTSLSDVLSESFKGMSKSLSDGADSWEEYGDNLKVVVKNIIGTIFAKATASLIASAIETSTLSGAGALILAPILSAAAFGIVKTAFSQIPGFQKGGIIDGNSFSGDNLLARVNSGEMILNKAQQGNLFKALNGSISLNNAINLHGEFEIKGDKLVSVISNYNKKTQSFR